MRCCTILLVLTVAIMSTAAVVYLYLNQTPQPGSNQTSSTTATPKPYYTSNWPELSVRASSTVLGRGTLTTSGQFDISHGGQTAPSVSRSSPSTSATTTTTTAQTTTTTTTTTTSTTTTTPISTTTTTTPATLSTTVKVETSEDPFSFATSTEKPTVAPTTPGSTEEIDAWKRFKLTHRRRYPNLEEEERRRSIFIDNKRFIDAHNSNPSNLFTLGINKFADYSNEEINRLFIGPRVSSQVAANYPPKIEFLSESETVLQPVDFRNTTAGKPVEQGLCLDSAVYAAVGAIESAITMAKQSDDFSGSSTASIKLSEQQVIDCLQTSGAVSSICSGKVSLVQVFEFLQKVPTSGLVSHKEYLEHQNTLEPAPQVCNITHPEERVTINSYGIVHQDHILEALSNSGPLAFPIDASQSSFHFYKSGIFHSANCSSDYYNYHSLLVGFAPEQNNTQSHYLIRNSLGSDWGEAGYMRLLKNPSLNKCLPQNAAIYPNLSLA